MQHWKRKASGHKYEVSMVTAAFAFGGLAAAATTVAGIGAATMAAGSVLGIKEAKPVGALMMAGGGIAAGGAGLGLFGGAATATGTLGTLSAGAQLVGGALQMAGTLTGNDKMAGIGGLINGAGFAGSAIEAMPSATATHAGAQGGSLDVNAVMDGTGKLGAPTSAAKSGMDVNAVLDGTGTLGAPTPAGVTGITQDTGGSIFDKINKYDNIIKMAGDFASGMAQGSVEADKLALEREKLALQYRNKPGIGLLGMSAPANPGAAQRIAPVAAPQIPGVE